MVLRLLLLLLPCTSGALPASLGGDFVREVASAEAGAARKALAAQQHSAATAHALAAIAALTRLATDDGDGAAAAWELASMHALVGEARWYAGDPWVAMNATRAALRAAPPPPRGEAGRPLSAAALAAAAARGTELMRWQLRLGRMLGGEAAATAAAAAAAGAGAGDGATEHARLLLHNARLLLDNAREAYGRALCREAGGSSGRAGAPRLPCTAPAAALTGGAFHRVALAEIFGGRGQQQQQQLLPPPGNGNGNDKGGGGGSARVHDDEQGSWFWAGRRDTPAARRFARPTAVAAEGSDKADGRGAKVLERAAPSASSSLFEQVAGERALLELDAARAAAERIRELQLAAAAAAPAAAPAAAAAASEFGVALRALRQALSHPCVALLLQHQPVRSAATDLAATAVRRALVLALVHDSHPAAARGGGGAGAAVAASAQPQLLLLPAPGVWVRTLPLRPLAALALAAFATEYAWHAGADELAAAAALRGAAARRLLAVTARANEEAAKQAAQEEEEEEEEEEGRGGRGFLDAAAIELEVGAANARRGELRLGARLRAMVLRTVALEVGRWRHLLAIAGAYGALGGAGAGVGAGATLLQSPSAALPRAARGALSRELLPEIVAWRREKRPTYAYDGGGSGGAGSGGGEESAGGGGTWDAEAEEAWDELLAAQVVKTDRSYS